MSVETGASLCDLAKMMADLGPARQRYFFSDGIHFNDEGDHYVADAVADCIAGRW
jgi:lysophospholipase L1-like esterase